MIRKLMMISMLMIFLAATTQAFAADVFVTPNGTKYHKEDCRLIRNKETMTKIDKKETIEEGYDPCKRCFKEDVIVDENQEK